MYSISEVAKQAGVAAYQIKYLLQRGVIPEPQRLNGRRSFTIADIEAVRRHFQDRQMKRKSPDAGRESRVGRKGSRWQQPPGSM